MSGLRKVLDYGSAPTAPQNVVASSNDATVTVTFSASDSFTPISLYRVYVDGVLAGTTTTSPYVQDNVTNGTKTYSVTAVNSVGESAAGVASPITVTVTPPAPGAPVYNAITIVSTSALDHSWTASTTGGSTTSYTLDRSLNGTTGWTNRYTGSATTFSDTGLSTGTQYFYRLRAFNTTVPSDVYSTRNATTLSSTSINLNKGNWWQITRSGNQLKQSHRIGTLYPQLFDNGNTTFKGIAVEYRWKDFEQTQGNVTPGITLLKAELDALRSYSPVRKLVIQFREERHGTSYANRADMFPAYLSTAPITNGVYEYGSTTLGDNQINIGWNFNNSLAVSAHTTMWTNLINQLKALPTPTDGKGSYWAQIEGFRPLHEMNNAAYGSTGPSNAGPVVSISAATYVAQMRSFGDLLRSLAPDKLIWFNTTDGFGGDSAKAAFLAHIATKSILCGHGDSLPRAASGTGTGSGADRDLTGDSSSPLNIDYRTTSAFVMGIEGSELGQGVFPLDPNAPDYTLQEHWDYSNTGAAGNAIPVRPLYMFWQSYTGTGTGSSYSIAQIKAFVHSNPTLANTATPANYP